MTKLEIINETVEFYSVNPRERVAYNISLNICEYLTKDGRSCAVGRCLMDPSNIPNLNVSALFHNKEIDDDSFQEKYRGHEPEFWRDLQIFHDKDSNWLDNGLSTVGKENLQKLKERY